jgi:response regulator RpfG family c-di-GMP phosphodiesterase
VKPKILIVDDYDEIRELVAFIIESQMEAQVLQEGSGFAAIEVLKQNIDIQLVISDLNMPNGTGIDILNFLRAQNKQTPMIFMTGEDLETNSDLKNQTHIGKIPKPFTDEQILTVLKGLLPAQEVATEAHYIPVRLELLKKIKAIKTPLFIKINDAKFVRVTQEQINFSKDLAAKYQSKDVTHLYIEFSSAQEFIEEYQKKTISDLAWEEAGDSAGSETVKLNTELLRSLSSQLGWSDELIDLAQSHVQRAMRVAALNPDLNKVFQQFHKIETYGYADHCALLFLVTARISMDLEPSNDGNLKKLTFAALFHDMTLSDEQYEHKTKYLKSIALHEPNQTKELKEVISHPSKAAELCRRWDFCPSIVDTIIFQHHERPDGSGFPMGKKSYELHSLSCLFIVCEDFVSYFIESYGKPDILNFIKTRIPRYNEGDFKIVFDQLVKTIAPALQKAS